MARLKQQDPDERLDYSINYATNNRLPSGDNIIDSDWIVPDGLTGDGESVSGRTATIFLSGGVINDEYKVVNRSTSAAGRTVEDYFILRIRESISVE
jgi:hypothetical protein